MRDTRELNSPKTALEEANEKLKAYEYEMKRTEIFKSVLLSRKEIQEIALVMSGNKIYYQSKSKDKTIEQHDLPYIDTLRYEARKNIGKHTWYLKVEGNKVKGIYILTTIMT